MKYTLIFLTLAIFNHHISTLSGAVKQKPQQTTNWDSTSNWKIYKLANFKAIFRIPADSLSYIESRPLSDDSVHTYLSGVSKLSSNPTWMGCYLLSYEMPDKSIRKVIISRYGGFFYLQKEFSYYQLDAMLQKDWTDYLSATYKAIPSKKN